MRRVLAAGLALTALSACSQTHTVAANSKICADFGQKAAVATAAPAQGLGDDGSAPVDNCARRWAYSLAPSRDRADVVAEAVVAACNGQLTGWNRASLGPPEGDGQAASLTTGQLTSPIQEHMGFVHSRALLYVVQARAGACAPPPATNGVPDGV
ncbi:hypothetical protein [Phenylobacterium sp.]|uniref:hypothetical protein n=1 Tax=Phenylobacterium sp. TaxID=1871053 RepID=UPI002C1AE420|nr:hypothetical protein [Phenylobacterium sp.]HLZ77082.1 hypothetical protein [Phenylobacterium sp.]